MRRDDVSFFLFFVVVSLRFVSFALAQINFELQKKKKTKETQQQQH